MGVAWKHPGRSINVDVLVQSSGRGAFVQCRPKNFVVRNVSNRRRCMRSAFRRLTSECTVHCAGSFFGDLAPGMFAVEFSRSRVPYIKVYERLIVLWRTLGKSTHLQSSWFRSLCQHSQSPLGFWFSPAELSFGSGAALFLWLGRSACSGFNTATNLKPKQVVQHVVRRKSQPQSLISSPLVYQFQARTSSTRCTSPTM